MKAETTLFKVRYETDCDATERQAFLSTQNFKWIPVGQEEKEEHKDGLLVFYHSAHSGTRSEEERIRGFQAERFLKALLLA